MVFLPPEFILHRMPETSASGAAWNLAHSPPHLQVWKSLGSSLQGQFEHQFLCLKMAINNKSSNNSNDNLGVLSLRRHVDQMRQQRVADSAADYRALTQKKKKPKHFKHKIYRALYTTFLFLKWPLHKESHTDFMHQCIPSDKNCLNLSELAISEKH